MKKDTVSILVVDDQADQLLAQFSLTYSEGGAKPRVRHPRDVDEDDLAWADVVLVDYRIEDWPERDESDCISQQPLFGVALAGIYREYLARMKGKKNLSAIAVHTAHLEDLSRHLPKEQSAHIVARLNNLEWAFRKEEDDVGDRVRALGAAVRSLPHPWPETAEDAVLALLSLDLEASWGERCWEDVLRSQVPLLDLVAGAHGLVFLRWMLHSILPHPTFLVDEHRLAVQLRIDPADVQRVLSDDSALAERLSKLEYRGVLAGFQGRRWWKGALEEFCWVNGRASGSDLHAKLEVLAGRNLTPIRMRSPCVCVGKNLRPTGELADIHDVVRLVPDLWPAFADYPTATLDLVRREPRLAAIVHPLDEPRLASGEE